MTRALPPTADVRAARARRARIRDRLATADGRAAVLAGFVERIKATGPIPPVLVAYDRPLRSAWLVAAPPLERAENLAELLPTMSSIVIGLPPLSCLTFGLDVDTPDGTFGIAVVDVAARRTPFAHLVPYTVEEVDGEARRTIGEPVALPLTEPGLSGVVAGLLAALALPREPDVMPAIEHALRRSGITSQRVDL